MSLLLTSGENTTDPVTGIPVIIGLILVTQDGSYISTQATGAAVGSVNEQPGTDANAPGDDDPGLPYGFEEVPETGPLPP